MLSHSSEAEPLCASCQAITFKRSAVVPPAAPRNANRSATTAKRASGSFRISNSTSSDDDEDGSREVVHGGGDGGGGDDDDDNCIADVKAGTKIPPARASSHSTPTVSYVLHETRQSFLDSLSQGCRFCLLISSQLVRNDKLGRQNGGDSSPDPAQRLRTIRGRSHSSSGKHGRVFGGSRSSRPGLGKPLGDDAAANRPATGGGTGATGANDPWAELGGNFMILRRSWPIHSHSSGHVVRSDVVEQQPQQKSQKPRHHKLAGQGSALREEQGPGTENEITLMEHSAATADVHVWSPAGSACLRVIDELPSDYEKVYHSSVGNSDHNRKKRKHKEIDFNGQTDDADPAAGPHLVVKDSTGSETNMALARLWLKDCLAQHHFCRTGVSSGQRLPRRLIDVGNPQRPFLLNVNALVEKRKVSYVALSYCWGEGERVMTLKSNYKQHLDRLPLENLPKTFSHAFEVTRKLGFQFVWTDAFCMIQDSPEDKEHELPKMGDIYRYAVLTICAEGSPNAHAGLFQHRDGRTARPCKIKLSTAHTDNTIISSVVTLSTKFVRTDYLEPRGWILQEEILACRRLLFGTQMRWSCITSTAEEVRPLPQPRQGLLTGGQRSPEDKLRMWLYEAPRMLAAVPDRLRSYRWNHFDAWYGVVEVYSLKQLTFAGDVLAAVEGLAQMFAQAHRVTYLDGLWKEDIQLGLGWYVCNNERRNVALSSDCWPSWSWASVGKVALRFRKWHTQAEHLVNEGAQLVNATHEGTDLPDVSGTLRLRARTMVADDLRSIRSSGLVLKSSAAEPGAYTRKGLALFHDVEVWSDHPLARRDHEPIFLK
ncbi:heterokaryon incompatibility protein-domain-containing protein [Microdochium trichocladiopsis]|uniref:Heterokaryon incompatibility protein-domain-containing protein n=1 Tax=Microdochium trichocladiopsis TaxID=1682393 RepID=A0A9P8Y602_9PEZI|nr:heterokaryon incompatibility protein-domain-containing protein [Microdochium trichocladiopsis]KAH7032715.1 heterokaryon incompatibility protein-domain-containing protein [Microdochium trichocladiopsis]